MRVVKTPQSPERVELEAPWRAAPPGAPQRAPLPIELVVQVAEVDEAHVELKLTTGLARAPLRRKCRSPAHSREPGFFAVKAEGIEPSTYGLRVHCSAN